MKRLLFGCGRKINVSMYPGWYGTRPEGALPVAGGLLSQVNAAASASVCVDCLFYGKRSFSVTTPCASPTRVDTERLAERETLLHS